MDWNLGKLWPFVFWGLLGSSCVGTGCQQGVQPMWSTANPTTNIRINPVTRQVEVFNNKDVSLHMGKITVRTSQGGSYELDGLDITDGASSVRMANVEQIEATTRLTQVVTALIAHMADTAAPLVGQGIAARHAEAMQPPKIAQVLDASGRLIGQFQVPQPAPAVASTTPATPSPATIIMPADAPPPIIVTIPVPEDSAHEGPPSNLLPPEEQDD